MKNPQIQFSSSSEGWNISSYNEIGENFKYGLSVPAIPYDGENKYLRITDIDDDTRIFDMKNLSSPGTDLSLANEYILTEGDITFARTGASVGKSYLYDAKDGKIYFAGFLIKIGIKKNVCASFIFQNSLTNNFKRYINLVSQRSGQPGINIKELQAYKLYIPKTLEEQQKIASYFKSLDSLIQVTSKKLASLKQIKAASLQSMFPQEGETVPKVRFKGFEGEWERCSLGSLSMITKGEQINKLDLYTINKYYVLNGGITPSGYTNKYNTEANTISISEGGNSCGYVNFNNEKFWSGGHNYTLQKVKINNYYLYSFLKNNEASIMSKRVGSGLPNIQKKSLTDFLITYPSLKEEQQKIASYFYNLDKQISLQTQCLEKLKQIKAACLDKMFV